MARRRRLGLVAAALAALAATGARADCICSGLDYTNGGSYLIDGSSSNNFVFTSEFAGKQNPERCPVAVWEDVMVNT